MALEMRTTCERCGREIGPGDEATICSYECTYCGPCAEELGRACPSCGGELVRRPRRVECEACGPVEADGEARAPEGAGRDIRFSFPIQAPPERVYEAISTPKGLDRWWTLSCTGEPRVGERYALDFGPDYRWGARVVRAESGRAFALEMVEADGDWSGSRVSFELLPEGEGTRVEFAHERWAAAGEHFRVSAFCWAMYLRIMRRWLEHGEEVEYAIRLDV